jgi:hypothetical protein
LGSSALASTFSSWASALPWASDSALTFTTFPSGLRLYLEFSTFGGLNRFNSIDCVTSVHSQRVRDIFAVCGSFFRCELWRWRRRICIATYLNCTRFRTRVHVS